MPRKKEPCTTRSISSGPPGRPRPPSTSCRLSAPSCTSSDVSGTEQLDELAVDAAEAVAAGDEPRRQVTYALRLAARSALTAIDAALRRLDEGTYGTCERCAEPIPWGRLEVLPMTGLCTDCQFRAESEQSNGSRRYPYLS